jgi:hypothetical protein
MQIKFYINVHTKPFSCAFEKVGTVSKAKMRVRMLDEAEMKFWKLITFLGLIKIMRLKS